RRERATRLLETARRAAQEDGTPVAAWYADLAETARDFILDNAFPKVFERTATLEREWYAAGRGPGWETDIVMHFSLSTQQMGGAYADVAKRVANQIQVAKRKGDLFQDVT